MKKLILTAALVLTASATLSAGTVYPRNTALGQCSARTVISSMGIGCTVGDKEFTNFATDLPPSWEVNILEVGAPSDLYRVDVAQAGNVFLTGPFPKNFGFAYDVKVVGQEWHYISEVRVSINPGGGLSTIFKQVHDMTGGLLGGSLGSASSSGLTGNIVLAPASQWIRVSETITANDSLLSSFTDTVIQSTVPEPATYGMMGLGLAALGLISRRKKS